MLKIDGAAKGIRACGPISSGSVLAYMSLSGGKAEFAKIGVPGTLIFRVEPKATVFPTPFDARPTQSRCARLNGSSSRSIAKKYCRKNSPSSENRCRNRPITG